MKPYVPFPFLSPKQNALLAQLNYDESKVKPYELPAGLVAQDGTVINSPKLWNEKRRPEILALFEEHIYGVMLPKARIYVTLVEECREALSGQATRRQVMISFPDFPSGPVLHLALYLPNKATQPAPCFLGLNFHGNHAAFDDPAIELSTAWMRSGEPEVMNNRSTPASRGTGVSRWPLDKIIDRGYALATLYYGDIEPDHEEGFSQSVRSMFSSASRGRSGNNAGAITAWAWGLSRVMDYLETVQELDSSRVCLTGHSRLGKTSLWAAANDQRFALVISNNSGCGGAALSRRNFGETLYALSNVRPHWFCENCRTHSARIDELPVDQHMLMALIAPRPVFVSSAENDYGADPLGEYLSCRHASDVYHLLGSEGMVSPNFPKLNQPIMSTIGYSIRSGLHDITLSDWEYHLDFADLHLLSLRC